MYNLQSTFEQVKARTAHLKDVVIAVMGCIVNGPGEMADADWGYVGEGNGKVSIYHKKEPVIRHVPESEAVDTLVSMIEDDQKQYLLTDRLVSVTNITNPYQELDDNTLELRSV